MIIVMGGNPTTGKEEHQERCCPSLPPELTSSRKPEKNLTFICASATTIERIKCGSNTVTSVLITLRDDESWLPHRETPPNSCNLLACALYNVIK